MTLVLLLYVIAFGLGIAMLVRVWSASVLDGILCLLVPFWTIVALIKYWKDPDHDIKLLFLGQLLVAGCAGALLVREARHVDHEAQLQQQADAGDADASGDASASARGSGAAMPSHGSRTAAAASASQEAATPPRAPTAEEQAPPPLRVVLRAVSFQIGRMEPSSAGFTLDIPDHFHALSAADAHRVEASLRLTPDPHESAWVAHESVALDAPDAWHVAVRWLPDGWVAAGGTLDPWQLLKNAQHGDKQRLAGSGGDLIGYAVAPSSVDGIVDWVEERLPPGANASVLDCHAVRLGRRGVLEFTVAGQPTGTQQLCGASVRLLARRARFEPEDAYPAAPPDGTPRAGYTLADLIAGH